MGESTTFESPVLTIEKDGHVATLWLDRPEARNAMGNDLWRDLPLAMEALDDDSDIRVVIIAAKGPHFTVGLDLKAMGALLTGAGEPSGTGPTSAAVKARGTRKSVL